MITHLPIFTVAASSHHVHIPLKQIPIGQNNLTLHFLFLLFLLQYLNFTGHNTVSIAFNVIVTLLLVIGEVRPYELLKEKCAFFILLVSQLVSGTTLC